MIIYKEKKQATGNSNTRKAACSNMLRLQAALELAHDSRICIDPSEKKNSFISAPSLWGTEWDKYIVNKWKWSCLLIIQIDHRHTRGLQIHVYSWKDMLRNIHLHVQFYWSCIHPSLKCWQKDSRSLKYTNGVVQ